MLSVSKRLEYACSYMSFACDTFSRQDKCYYFLFTGTYWEELEALHRLTLLTLPTSHCSWPCKESQVLMLKPEQGTKSLRSSGNRCRKWGVGHIVFSFCILDLGTFLPFLHLRLKQPTVLFYIYCMQETNMFFIVLFLAAVFLARENTLFISGFS